MQASPGVQLSLHAISEPSLVPERDRLLRTAKDLRAKIHRRGADPVLVPPFQQFTTDLLALTERVVQATPKSDESGEQPALVRGTEASAPSWYRGEKPWSEISEEGRRKLLAFRRGVEKAQAKARQPSGRKAKAGSADRGEAVVLRMHRAYSVHDYYRIPRPFRSRMAIWLPAEGWASLPDADKTAVRAWMQRYKNWAIGVGRMSGTDILADRLIEKSK